MRRFKNLVSTVAVVAASLVSVATLAGGPDYMAKTAMAVPAADAFQPNVYVEGGIGYAQTNYYDGLIHGGWLKGNDTASNDKDGNGGFVWGVDAGYHFMPHLAAELGGGMLPTGKYTHIIAATPTSAATTDAHTASSWYVYGAGRLDMQLITDLGLYAKVGVAYRAFHDESNQDVKDSYWGPFFGVGLSYSMQTNLYLAAEYNRIGGTTDSDKNEVIPAANLYMVKVGYKFNM